VAKILGVMLTVADLEKMTTFFTEVLSFKKIGSASVEGKAYANFYGIPGVQAQFSILKLGQQYLYLIAFNPSGKSYPPTRSNDHLFQHIAIVVSDMEKAHRLLSQHAVTPISEGFITIPEWNEAAAGIQAFYFRSPEGHPLELIYFPPKKGHAHWQAKDKLFLGIDHTAITIFHTEKSLRFYQGQLGMKVMGESLNHGSTQELLTGVEGAKVMITGLGYPDVGGMGLEFLHYLLPLTGVAMPDLQSNDLGCTYTIIEVDNLADVATVKLSDGVFSPYEAGASASAALGRDPDGHRIVFVKQGV